MSLFLYRDLPSPVHRLDPRTKLFLLLGSFAAAVLFTAPLPLLALLGVILAYGALGRVLANIRRIGLLLASIGGVSLVSWGLFAGGTTPLPWGFTREGLVFGAGAALKIDGMILSGLVFLSTTRSEEIVLGLIGLRVPYRAAFAFSLGIRMVPTILGTAATVAQAQRSRGLDLDGGPLRRLRTYVPLLVPILLNTLRSTDQLARALEARGFGARSRRTSYLEIGMHARDAVALLLGAVVLAAFVVWRLDA
ncbi:MAG: energy-coupling factor transporter transmembrane component T [Candidatus Latescibacterota bacterium]